MAVKERMSFHEPNGRKFSKTAIGVDAAAAAAFAETIAAITVGNIDSITVTTDVAPVDFPDTGPGSYSDATFHFRKGTENVNVHFEQLSNDCKEVVDGYSTGYVELTRDDITAYADAWSTAHGGGWSLISAHYVK